MHLPAAVILIGFLASLGACGAPAGNGNAGDLEQKTEEPVFDSMVKTIDEAEAVEELTRQQKARMDAALSQMEEGKKPERR